MCPPPCIIAGFSCWPGGEYRFGEQNDQHPGDGSGMPELCGVIQSLGRKRHMLRAGRQQGSVQTRMSHHSTTRVKPGSSSATSLAQKDASHEGQLLLTGPCHSCPIPTTPALQAGQENPSGHSPACLSRPSGEPAIPSMPWQAVAGRWSRPLRNKRSSRQREPKAVKQTPE